MLGYLIGKNRRRLSLVFLCIKSLYFGSLGKKFTDIDNSVVEDLLPLAPVVGLFGSENRYCYQRIFLAIGKLRSLFTIISVGRSIKREERNSVLVISEQQMYVTQMLLYISISERIRDMYGIDAFMAFSFRKQKGALCLVILREALSTIGYVYGYLKNENRIVVAVLTAIWKIILYITKR